MRKTEEAIRRSMDQLKTSRPLVWEALELKKRLSMWQTQTASLNALQLVSATVRTRKGVHTFCGNVYGDPLALLFLLLCSRRVELTRLDEATLLARASWPF